MSARRARGRRAGRRVAGPGRGAGLGSGPCAAAAATVAALLLGAFPLRAQGDPSAAPPAASRPDQEPSPWYLEREPPATSELPAGVPSVVADLEALLRDGGVPGFYDGQFAATADRFDELLAVAHDEDLHHVLRVMAVMALQEAGEGERLAAALEPLLVNVETELQVDRLVALRMYMGEPLAGRDAEAQVRRELRADLSRHARFALAKAGQPAAILERIEWMEMQVARQADRILDPRADAASFSVFYGRNQWFSIAYHYQQFDDYANAAKWFRALTENLRGSDARWAHYNLACMAALQGDPDTAMVELRAAVEDGFADLAWMDEDGDLASLRGRADYQALRADLGGAPISNTAPVESPAGG